MCNTEPGKSFSTLGKIGKWTGLSSRKNKGVDHFKSRSIVNENPHLLSRLPYGLILCFLDRLSDK